MVHPLKLYLEESGESVAAFADRVSASRQTIYRIINAHQTPRPELARRLIAATAGAVTFNDFFGSEGSGTIHGLTPCASAPDLDERRLKLALSIAVDHLLPTDSEGPPDAAMAIAAEAAVNTYAALKPVTSRSGPDRLTQALRPVLEEILREFSDPIPPTLLDRGASLATSLYEQSWSYSDRRR